MLEPCQGGDICSLAGLTWPQVMSSSNNVLLAVQAWGTPSAWRHVPRPPIWWVLSSRWVLSEPCQYIPCPLLPTTWSRALSARHTILIDNKYLFTVDERTVILVMGTKIINLCMHRTSSVIMHTCSMLTLSIRWFVFL